VQLLLACRDNVVLANACGTVANMALQSDCRTAIMQEGAPQPLISLVESSEEQQVIALRKEQLIIFNKRLL
jgi:hypothetical protein